MPSHLLLRTIRPHAASPLTLSLTQLRTARHAAHDALLDPTELDEARKWRASFKEDSLPSGRTSYSRSSGPGGQHVNKTETKATSVWPVAELGKGLPKLMQSALRSSRYYTMSSDAITIQAQTQRSRTANKEQNRHKLFQEIHRIYQERVPGVTSEVKMRKHEAIEKASNESRLKVKKHQSSKKASRKGGGYD
ncbi:hypothetical protein F4802DRAFT_566053 [Xylaria palmicola]|nr:hypothetical protein F4802DRAFT_566053 [Xylaria palmicola]